VKPGKFTAVVLGGILGAGLLTFFFLPAFQLTHLLGPVLGLLAWVGLLTIAGYSWVYPSLKESGHAFTNRILALTMLRLFLGIALVFLLYFLFPEEIIPLVVLFFFYYSAGLAFEIFQLLRNLRDISK
jgi:hypothetical protein